MKMKIENVICKDTGCRVQERPHCELKSAFIIFFLGHSIGCTDGTSMRNLEYKKLRDRGLLIIFYYCENLTSSVVCAIVY